MKGLQRIFVFLAVARASFFSYSWSDEASLHRTRITSEDVLPAVEEFLADVRDGEIAKAYQDGTSEEFKQSMSLESFEQFVADHQVLEKNVSFQPHTFYIEGRIATFDGSLSSVENPNQPTEIDLVEEDDGWKVYGLQLFKVEVSAPRPNSIK